MEFNNFETLQMSPDGKDLSHIASEITSGRKMDENGEAVTASRPAPRRLDRLQK
jgi:hypothetical protein